MSWPRRRFDEMRIALMLLTRIPAGRVADPAPTPADSCWAYPIIGIPVGVAAWLGFEGAVSLGCSPGIAALSAICIAALVTGGLHHDGLADFADGIFGGRDRAHRLDIMRDSRIGTYGVLALVLVLALMAQAIADLDAKAPLAIAFVLTAIASRLAMLAALIWLPPAREDGLGQLASSSDRRHLWIGVCVCFAVSVAMGSPAAATLLSMAAVAVLLGLLAQRSIGGQTGDVLGAIQLTTEAAGWIILSTTF